MADFDRTGDLDHSLIQKYVELAGITPESGQVADDPDMLPELSEVGRRRIVCRLIRHPELTRDSGDRAVPPEVSAKRPRSSVRSRRRS